MTIYNINFEVGMVSVDGNVTHDKLSETLVFDLNYTVDGGELQKFEMVFNGVDIGIDQRYDDNGGLVNFAYVDCGRYVAESPDYTHNPMLSDNWVQIEGIEDKHQNTIVWMALQAIADQEYLQSVSGDNEL